MMSGYFFISYLFWLFVFHFSRRCGGGEPRLDRGCCHPHRRRHRSPRDGLQRLVQRETVTRTAKPNRGRADLQRHQVWRLGATGPGWRTRRR